MPKTFNTADEAEAWLRANPMRVIVCEDGCEVRFNYAEDCIELNYGDGEWLGCTHVSSGYAPYTVVEEKTITINGTQYREGDVYDQAGFDILGYEGLKMKLIIAHIPDELADKPEPKTLTFEDVSDRDAWFINPVNGSIDCIYPGAMSHYYALKAHLENGGKLYASREDAERGKGLGWS